MGGILAPATTIGGTVLSPGIPLLNSPLSGLFQDGNGLGIGINSQEFFKLNAISLALGYIPPVAFAPTQIAGSPYASAARTIVVTLDGTGVLVGNITTNAINAYSRNPVTGVLTAVGGSPFDTGNVSDGASTGMLAVNPAGNVVAAYSGATGALRTYLRNPATGTLTVSGNYIAGLFYGYGPILFTPDGNFVIVSTNNAVVVASVNAATGALTQVAGSPFAASTNARSLAISPNGKFVYVGTSNGTGNDIVIAYTRNSITGALTPIANYQGPNSCFGCVVTPDNSQLLVANYVAGGGAGNIFVYNINPVTGALTAAVGSPFACGNGPYCIDTSPLGDYVYVGSSSTGGLTILSRNTSTGALAIVAGSPFPAGAVNKSLTVTVDGANLLTANETTGAIYVYQFGTTSPKPLETLTFDPSGGSGGGISINGTLTVSGGIVVGGLPVSGIPAVAGNVGKFLRTDGATTMWDGVTNYLPVAMVANAGACAVVESGITAIEVTGALTANGALTVTNSVGADPFFAMVDNKCTGAFPLIWNATWIMPPGKSLWYWDGTASFECVAQNTTRAQSVAMVANAATLILYDQCNNYVDVSGVLTANGQITTTFPTNATQVTFDNATTGAFLLQINAGAYTLPPGKSTWTWNGTVFEMVNSYVKGTWTPNQGAGLTVVGAFTSSGTYTLSDGVATVTGVLTGATSIAVNAVGVMCTNLPFLADAVTAIGVQASGALTTGGQVAVGGSSTTLYSCTAMAPTAAGLLFTVTYKNA